MSTVVGIKTDTEVIELIQSYGFSYDIATTANSILYGKKRTKKKNIAIKQFEAIYEAHNKLGMTIDTFSIIERMGLSKRLKIQPEEGQVRIRRIKDYVMMYLEGIHLSSVTEEQKSRMIELSQRLDDNDGLPVLVPDSAVAVIRHVLIQDGQDTATKKLGRPIASVAQALRYLRQAIDADV